ncbi:hypothetical protein SAMN02910356_01372 [Selenomonas sp. GACV-9]|uniref:hypothetical protein n=1 Tax=Selenomonas sp. GACV-9 TaxID=3158782 RepID=UPI0008EC22B2|nr:hypothetical protein SAMN02910356_01372 [Selenomonas ruminantium]
MADRRNMQKNHIRAARDWLGEAEHSLEHENDIQGDLKLMLARAELSQVQDSPCCARIKCWGKRLLPPVVAVLLAGIGILAWTRSSSEEPVPEGPVAAEITEPTADPMPTAPAQQLPDNTVQPITADPAAREAEAPSVPDPLPQQEAPERPKRELPDPQKQRLMQSAGKILRQQ